ncbi:uncharacterized protein MONBRDRAFT_22138 [Monosiga brevicollis MX1]|uniref:Uncharacterized protein n=1 Tax=Monosiga brevicollis TaxID=81824 RepID=A9UPN9_MONBE|nr:uncharacterized protein MONBRDRAFT_22138 [Monosiga brevicollis MX1]EDQ92904.1 predicted protein [Monosiga brevicollis MX1]|eukprot:XP_001742666.1 hypothetical protein [Monosiga brevicollis MX1]
MADSEAPAVKQGGWGDDKAKTSRRSKAEEDQEDERLTMTTVPGVDDDEADESDDEIPTIPEAAQEADQEADITTQIAEAPNAKIQITTIADLDRDLEAGLDFTKTVSHFSAHPNRRRSGKGSWMQPDSQEGGIDLSALAKNLTPKEQLLEVRSSAFSICP